MGQPITMYRADDGSIHATEVEMGRRFVGVELKSSYYTQAVANMKNASRQGCLFDLDDKSAA